MKPMTGEIGKLSLSGKQVGGFKYWTAIQNRDSLQTHVIAPRFWMLQEISTNKLEADFYSHNFNDKLELVYSANVTVSLPKYEVGKMMSKRIDMDLGTFDWLQGRR